MKFTELSEKNMELRSQMNGIMDKAKAENRPLNADESMQYEQLRSQHNANLMEMNDLKVTSEYRKANGAEKTTLVSMVRNAMNSNNKTFSVPAFTEKRAATVASIGENVVETEIQGILEPLYANSALAKLGVKWYSGLPQGDISVPVMGKGTVGWASEVAAAGATSNAFSNVVLQPKRLCAFIDISKKLLAQDTIGVEDAIRRDIVNALNDKLEATIFGNAAATADMPKGMFYGDSAVRTLEDGTTFANICKIEAEVEDNNFYGDMKYLLSTGAKADLRAMAKSTKNTQLVYEGGEVDGVPAITTSNVKTAGAYIYGDWSNLAIGSWGDIDITLDENSQAVNGCVRLVVNAFFDAKILREAAFAYGKTRA